MPPKVLVIGLDGGTFTFIKPLVKDGGLPNLASLMERGVSRVLKSTIPPVSPPAWTTFLTGRNPGSHGIYQFVDMDVSVYEFTKNRLINSSLFAGETFIDFIGGQQMKVGVVKIPFTYPPWKVNGFMVAGEPSPDWQRAHTYPEELAGEIGRVNMGSAADFLRYNTEKLFEHLMFDCRKRTELTTKMMPRDDYDFFMVVHNITDAALHRFWKFTDETCPNYKDSFKKHENIINQVYEAADDSIGQILQLVDDETTVFIMSDHGAARKPTRFFHVNAWLREQGFLQVKGGGSAVQSIYSMLAAVKRKTPPLLRQLIMRLLKSYFQKNISNFETRAANFDWQKTRAYAVNIYNYFDGIALNIKGRQPGGIVSAGSEAESLCREIKDALKSLKIPGSDRSLVRNVYRREEIYDGPFVDRMPDLIVEYDMNFRSGKKTAPPLFTDVPTTDFDFQSGDHHEDGIFMAAGPHIRSLPELSSVNIKDMAPTILYAMGLPVPDTMDGRVMQDIFSEDFIRQNPFTQSSVSADAGFDKVELSSDEEKAMKEQLKGLGYM